MKKSCLAGAGAAIAPFIAESAATQVLGQTSTATPQVALTTGEDRADNVLRALRSLRKPIKRAIAGRRVIIKPNLVSLTKQLASTHPDCLEGIIEFFRSIGHPDIAIAECPSEGTAREAYSNFNYTALATRYGVQLMDFEEQPAQILYVLDQTDLHPKPVRVSSLLLDPNSFIVSSAILKTHDRVIATLSLKNIVIGAPLKDPGFRWWGGTPGAASDKPICHGGGTKGINYNLFALSYRLRPHLSVIDGFKGMEGNGPTEGTAVDHRVAIASTDWLAADRVGVELMGIDFSKIGYLTYCAQAGLGQADLEKINVIGERIADHKRSYRLHDNIDEQLNW